MTGRNCIIYCGKKVLIFILSVFVLSVTVFYVSRLAPGDPLISYYGDRVEKMSPAEREWAEDQLGLNDPISVQYFRWLDHAFRGDFGISYKYKTDVVAVIGSRIGNTLLLGGIGFLLIFVFSLLLGILCAWYEDKLPDRIICKVGTAMSCIPEFWMSLVLILIFAVGLRILPSSGAYSVGNNGSIYGSIYGNIPGNLHGNLPGNLQDRIAHLILPVTVIVISHLWYYAYMVRNKILEEVCADYVLLAKSKGLKKRSVMFRHCLRNTVPSYLSIMAISVPHVLTGTYIVETVFSYPGIGTLSYESARYKDYNLLMLLCILSGILVILCSMIAQAINERIDPRLRPDDVWKNSENGSGR